jgi:guanine deaminase
MADARLRLIIVELASPDGVGIGALDFFDDDPVTMADSSDWWQEAIEKWWCVGSAVNRKAMFVQGRQVR